MFNASTGNGARINKISFVLIFLLLLLALSGYSYSNYVVFQVRSYEDKDLLFSRYMKKGETFTLEFTHSVTTRPIYEVYYVRDKNTLALKEMRFDEYGSNLPAGPEKTGSETTEFIIEDGSYRVLFQNRTFDSILLRTGNVIVNHTLVFEDGLRVPFLEITPGGSLIKYSVHPITAVLHKGSDRTP